MIVLLTLLIPSICRDDYVFIPSNKTPARLFIFDSEIISIQSGYINLYGTFVCETVVIKYDNTRLSKEPAPEIIPRTFRKLPRQIDISEGCINHPLSRNEQVYEFRSGRLIPGYLQQNFDFLPEPGEAIIEFKDYVYSKTSKRIYNLPGKFVKKSEYESEKIKMEEAEKRKP